MQATCPDHATLRVNGNHEFLDALKEGYEAGRMV
jgi:hypothetical protein